MKKSAKKSVSIAKGKKVTPKKAASMRKKAGGSNVGEYSKLPEEDFAGKKGSAPAGSYPINTLKRAKAALSYAHNAPNPAGIKKAVYAKYPQLKNGEEKKSKNK